MKFKAACLQTNCRDDLDANVAQVASMLREAAGDGAQLITLPENSFYMGAPGTKPPAFEPENHPGIAACQQAAKEHKAWVLVGSIPVPDKANPDKVHNTSVVINGEGEIVTHYQKIHLFDVDLGNGEKYAESARFSAGCAAKLVETPWGKLGLSICYDVRFPQLYRQLAQAGASMLTVPAAFTAVTGKAHWHVLNRARAIENGCFVFAPAQWGEHPGKRFTYGHSLIISPWGDVLADGGEGIGVSSAYIDMDAVLDARRKLPSLTHDREFTLDA